MAPKKCGRQANSSSAAKSSKAAKSVKKRPRGLLGLASGYNSESDDDYQPTEPAKKHKPGPAKINAKGKSRRTTSPAPSSSDGVDSDADSECSYDSDSSDSGETLAARQQRQLSKPPAQPACGRGRAASARSTSKSSARGSKGRGRAASAGGISKSPERPAPGKGRGGGASARKRSHAVAPPAVITTWDQLPTAVLAQIFLAVCKHGALPMAPRLACVCTSWTAAVAATPELWRLIDTAAIPNRAWDQHPGSARSPPGKNKGTGTKSAGKAAHRGSTKQQQLSAEQGLSQWVASGRLHQLQALLLHGEGGSNAGYSDPDEGAGRDANRQLSAALLMQIADGCQQLQRVSLFGAWSLRPEEVSRALLSMPALSELVLCGMRFSAFTGLSSCLCSVLEAAAVSGFPRLKELVGDGCHSLGQKVVTALCAPAVQPRAAEAADGNQDDHQQQEQQQAQVAGPPQAAAAASGQLVVQLRSPAFPHLEVLDLSHSAGLMGRPFKLQVDDMQAAMPNLRVLKLTGLGGLYGWLASVRNPATLPGFPALESLHIGCALSAPLSGRMKLLPGSSYVSNTVLLQLAGKSCRLHALDLSGSLVTPDGLRQLAAAHTACRPAACMAAPPVADAANPAAGGAAGPEDLGAGGDATAEDAAGEQQQEEQETAQMLAGALGTLHVQDLQLDGSALACDEGLIAVGQCCSDTLEQLVVRNAGGRLGDKGLGGLRGCLKLSTLDIAGCSVTEEGLRELLEALPAGVLEELHLDSCRSLSRGARQAAAKGVGQLQQHLAAAS